MKEILYSRARKKGAYGIQKKDRLHSHLVEGVAHQGGVGHQQHARLRRVSKADVAFADACVLGWCGYSLMSNGIGDDDCPSVVLQWMHKQPSS